MMMQDFNMYGNHCTPMELPQISAAWLRELDNISKQVDDGGLAQLQDIKGFPESCDMLLNSDIDIDVADFSMEWMEEYIPLDSLPILEDILDDAAFHQMALSTCTSPDDHSNSKINVEPDTDQNQIADTLQQLMQLQAMVEPESVYPPSITPKSIDTPPNSPQHIYEPISPESVYTCHVTPKTVHTPPTSPINIYEPITPERVFTPPISPEDVFSFPISPEANIGSPISPDNVYISPISPEDFYTSPISPQAFGDIVMPTFTDYSVPVIDNIFLCSPSSTEYSSPESSPSYCYSPQPSTSSLGPAQAPVQINQSPFDDIQSDFSVSSPSAMSDSSQESSSSSCLDAPAPSRKRLSASRTTSQTKRSKRANPNQQPEQVVKIKKERKKDQNKTAATRYRLKKRSEAEVLSKEESELLDKNKELKSNVDKLSTEIGYLKGLLKEILAARSASK